MPKIPNRSKPVMYGIYSQRLNKWVCLLADPAVWFSHHWAERYFKTRERELTRGGYRIVPLGVLPEGTTSTNSATRSSS